MGRLPRYPALGYAHHVVQRGNNRVAMFLSEADRRFFYACLRDACERYGCAIHAYVFMTNHIHLLVTPAESTSISKALQSVGSRYVPYFNRVHGRTGSLWEGRYRSTVVETERYLATCHRYVELNPVRAGMVNRPADHAWSSHRANANGDNDQLVTPHAWYHSLGADPSTRQVAYRGILSIPETDADLVAIRNATHRGWALGSTRFLDDVRERGQRRGSPRRRGRPCTSDSTCAFESHQSQQEDSLKV